MRAFGRRAGSVKGDSSAEPLEVAEKIDRVAIVGAGTMGQQIAFQCAGHGISVVLYDVSAAALEDARTRIGRYADGLLADGVIAEQVRDRALARITTSVEKFRKRRNRMQMWRGEIGTTPPFSSIVQPLWFTSQSI